jgi:alpha-tubulin suppressor-like RCC1 family protein
MAKSCIAETFRSAESVRSRNRHYTLRRLGSIAAVLTLGMTGSLVLGITSESGAASLPTVSGFSAKPASLATRGGVVTLSANVSNSTRCRFTSTPFITGMPSTIACSTTTTIMRVMKKVTAPANATSSAVTYKFNLSVIGATTTVKAKAVTVTVAGSSTGATKTVASGDQHTCAVVNGGQVDCWGLNANGQLGNGLTTNSLSPVTVTGLSGVTAVAAGGNDSCALLTGGTVKCWGFNGSGELGNGTTADSSTPVTVTGISGVSAIEVGFLHSCAVLLAGAVDCWGFNGSGELGDGTITGPQSCSGNPCSTVPVAVSGLSGVTGIAAGDDHSCAVVAAGAVDCWGGNTRGQLGNGTTTGSSVPVAVSGLSGATSVATGAQHACALLAGGAIACWGVNDDGELGNGSTVSSTTPVAVSGLVGATAVAVGGYHACALVSGGAIDCWGYNLSGELGNGAYIGNFTYMRSTTPVSVIAMTGATTLDSGGDHSCAVRSGNALDCWGYNAYGELGDGTSTSSSTPVVVSGL